MDWHSKTVKVYDDSARLLAAYYASLGSQVDDIERALQLANVGQEGRVVEIGCGDGRDAVEIARRVRTYEGFDPSSGMLQIARSKLPRASFVVADAMSYNYPSNVDVIFAFASLLHVNKATMKIVFQKVAQSLRSDGVLYISLKERSSYIAESQTDSYGQRMYYYYNAELIKKIAGGMFVTVYEAHQRMSGGDWFTIGLRRI